MTLQLIDKTGSVELSELTIEGRQNAKYQAEQMLEELDRLNYEDTARDLPGADDDDSDVSPSPWISYAS